MYLNCHSYFSLRYGIMSPEQLVARARELDIKVLGLTDINNTSCAIEFAELCRKAGIKPLLGVEFRQDNRLLYVGLARSEQGWFELNQLLTSSSLNEIPLPERAPFMSEAYVIYPFSTQLTGPLQANEYIGIRPGEVTRLFRSSLLKCPDKLVVLQPVTFASDDERMWNAHRLLRSIDANVVLSRLKEADCSDRGDFFVPQDELLRRYAAYPFIINNTQKLLDNCNISFSPTHMVNRQVFDQSEEEDFCRLTQLAMEGYRWRYGYNPFALKRIQDELQVIRKHGFCTYFLVSWDIVQYAKSRDFWYVGRGSGANSIVAFCLGLTDVEPLELDLYFERFINPYRKSPPDFDIDFSWKDRDEIFRYIYNRYGEGRVALLASYNTFNYKSVVRELGKVYGLPKSEIDFIVRRPEAIRKHHELSAVIMQYGKLIDGFPNYLSIHAGGLVIAERPLNFHTALRMMPKGFAITHFDMYHAEQLGFHKYDILSQRGLGHIRDAIELIRVNQGKNVSVKDVKSIFKNEEVQDNLSKSRCMGCFYVESPAMRGLLSKLKCKTYRHLVAASSIIRPGVAQSGMMREYIRRFHQPETIKYLHPVFEEHLGETFGVMVYQEDTLKILHHFAGLDLGESDVLRRIMSGKKYKQDTLAHLKKKYYDNCRQRGHPEELASEVWRQIESFSGYSFCKAHSASFAVESFQSLYLKTYFPIEHAVAVVNNFGGFYQSEFYLHEAGMHGAQLHPPCVNHSEWLVTLYGKEVYIGFVFLKEFQVEAAQYLVEERKREGPFQSLEDFIRRVEISATQLDILIRIGAFRFTGKAKCELMWEKGSVLSRYKQQHRALVLFEEPEDFTLPTLEEGEYDQAFDEIELMGFPLCWPFRLLRNREKYLARTIPSRQFRQYTGKKVKVLGYYVCKKDVRTARRDLMAFGTWLDVDGYHFDTTHFSQALQRFPFQGKGIYLIEGTVVEEFDFPSIEVFRMERLPYVLDERYWGDEEERREKGADVVV